MLRRGHVFVLVQQCVFFLCVTFEALKGPLWIPQWVPLCVWGQKGSTFLKICSERSALKPFPLRHCRIIVI